MIHIYGRLEDGSTFLVRDNRQHPHFYIRAADAERAHALRAPKSSTTGKRTFDGAPVCRLDVATPPDVPALRDRLHAADIDTFEADVRFAVRYLIERGIKGGCEIDGEASPGNGVTWIFDNPLLRPADVKVEPRVLSFDIETDGKAQRLLAISLYSQGPDATAAVDEVLIVDGSNRVMPDKSTRCADEFAALDAFCERIATLDPDVITGWNTIDFDFTVLQRIAARVRHPFILGRDAAAIRIRKAEGYFGSGQATIPGRLVLDGIDLLRGAFVRMDDYSLDAAAREVLGEGKAVAGDVHDRIAEIMHNYRHDLPVSDSLFVHSGSNDPDKAYEQGRQLAATLNDEIARYINERWRVPSRLELKFEKLYLKLFLPRARHSTRGASKRYAGLLHGKDSVEFIGMEVVRRDWTALARQVQRELYQRLFADQPVDSYLADVVKQVRSGALDDALVYRKNLRKGADDYTATTPPHVVAARKSKQPPGRLISYVITTAGPEPLDNVQHPLDREHYVVKQIKPVAEPVLATLRLDFERVIGDSRQIDLYSLFDEV